MANYTLRWDQALPVAKRFVVMAAFNNEAVLDKNTGLVWEKSPTTTTNAWVGACHDCLNKIIGGQKGWRLPSIPELASLVDPSVASPGPTLPLGHPFLNVQPNIYWSATSVQGFTDQPGLAWIVTFFAGEVTSNTKTDFRHVWCVRGGMNADAY